jgi:NADPH:quinone reductase-like Zn-dependent oxidoreductase
MFSFLAIIVRFLYFYRRALPIYFYYSVLQSHFLTPNQNNPEDGAFAEYAMVRDGHLAPIPDSMSFEEAATLGVGITSVGQALYMEMGLPLPVVGSAAGDKEAVEVDKQSEKFILIYGGSTATGTLAIQFAKL